MEISFSKALGLLIMFLLLGIIWAMADTKFGVPTRRWLHRMTHKDPLPLSDRRGFIVGQPARRKLWFASIISFVQSAYVVWRAEEVDFTVEIIMWALEAGFMVAGFYLVTPFIRLGDFLLDKVATRLDKVESKEITLKQLAGEMAGQVARGAANAAGAVAKDVTEKIGDAVGEKLRDAREALTSSPPEPVVNKPLETLTPSATSEESAPEQPQKDPRAVLERFTGGNRHE
ncbi:MAG: hypothetical protein AAB388_04080 [Patescibacteria group bacterium]